MISFCSNMPSHGVRTAQGTTNRTTESTPRSLDSRGLIGSCKSSTAKHAPECHHAGVPPALPSPNAVLKNFVEREPLALPPVRPVGALPSPGVADVDSLQTEVRTQAVRRIHNSGREPAPKLSAGVQHEHSAFTRAVFHVDGGEKSTSVVPVPVTTNMPTRSGCNKFVWNSTFEMVTPPAGASPYAAPQDRFDHNYLGLNRSNIATAEKLKEMAAREVRATMLRSKICEVDQSRIEVADRLKRLDEGRIRSKADQRMVYNERLGNSKSP